MLRIPSLAVLRGSRPTARLPLVFTGARAASSITRSRTTARLPVGSLVRGVAGATSRPLFVSSPPAQLPERQTTHQEATTPQSNHFSSVKLPPRVAPKTQKVHDWLKDRTAVPPPSPQIEPPQAITTSQSTNQPSSAKMPPSVTPKSQKVHDWLKARAAVLPPPPPVVLAPKPIVVRPDTTPPPFSIEKRRNQPSSAKIPPSVTPKSQKVHDWLKARAAVLPPPVVLTPKPIVVRPDTTPPPFSIEKRRGCIFTRGANSEIYQDKRDPAWVIKSMHKGGTETRRLLEEEAMWFNKYYGPGSATVITVGGTHHIHMKKVTGEPINSLTSKERGEFAPALNSMVDRLLALGIVHADMTKPENLLCDLVNQEINPVDIKNCNSIGQLQKAADYINRFNGPSGRRIEVVHDASLVCGGTLAWVAQGAAASVIPDPFKPDHIGSRIAGGVHADVHEDTSNEDRVIKVAFNNDTDDCLKRLKEEEFCFNKFYGAGSAKVFTVNEKHYLRMSKIEGISLKELGHPLVPSVVDGYNDAINKMHSLGIVHDDCHKSNFILEMETGTVNPIDIGRCVLKPQFWMAERLINMVNGDSGSETRVKVVPDQDHESGAKLTWVQGTGGNG